MEAVFFICRPTVVADVYEFYKGRNAAFVSGWTTRMQDAKAYTTLRGARQARTYHGIKGASTRKFTLTFAEEVPL